MKKQGGFLFRAVPLVLVSVALMFSCVFDAPREKEKEAPAAEELPLSDRLSIDDARVFYDEPGAGLVVGPNVGSRSGSDPLEIMEPDWSQAVYSVLLGEDVIEVPFTQLAHTIGFRLAEDENPQHESSGNEAADDEPAEDDGTENEDSGEGNSEEENPGEEGDPKGEDGHEEGDPEGDGDVWAPEEATEPNTGMKLIVSLDDAGEIVYRVLYLTSSYEWASDRGLDPAQVALADTNDSFSGIAIVHGLDGGFIEGYIYEDGERIRDIFMETPATRSVPDDQGDCIYYHQYWWWCRYYPGTTVINYDTCVYLGSVFLAKVCDSLLKDTSDDGLGNGSVGGGGDDKDKDSSCSICKKHPCVCCKVCGTYPCICCSVCKDCPCICCFECGAYICECKEPEDDCESLKKKLLDEGFMDKFRELQGLSGIGNDREYGYTFRLGANGEYIFSKRLSGNPGGQSIIFSDTDQDWFDGILHSHYPGCGNIFSFGDLFVMMQSRFFEGNLSATMFGLATPYGLYFLAVEDLAAYLGFSNLCLKIDSNPDGTHQWGFRDYAMEMEEAYFKIGLGVDTPWEDAEKLFTRFLKENSVGLKLIKYNQNNSRFESYGYNDNNDTITIDWCPN